MVACDSTRKTVNVPAHPASDRITAADLAPALARSTARRSEALHRARHGDPAAALELIELGEWDAMAHLQPFEPPLVLWRDSDEKIAPDITVRQLWGDLAANWAVRQLDFDSRKRTELMLQAREQLGHEATNHPGLLLECAWLFEDVEPNDLEHARLLKLQARTRLAESPPHVDGGRQAQRLLLNSELVEGFKECLDLLAQAADETIDDPLMRLTALRTWITISDRGRSPPQLDIPIAERHGMFGSRTGGGKRGLDPRVERWQQAHDIAVRCGDVTLQAATWWASAEWAEAHRSRIDQRLMVTWARRAAEAYARAGDQPSSAEALALSLLLDPSDAQWQAHLDEAESALAALDGNAVVARARLHAARGLRLAQLGFTADAADAFSTSSLILSEQASKEPIITRCWLDFAHAAARVGTDPGPIHEVAIHAWVQASEQLWNQHDITAYAIAQRECARFVWNDGPQMRREAMVVYRDSAKAFASVGSYGWAEELATMTELADRLREANDNALATVALLDAADLWRERSRQPDDAAMLHVRELEERIGITHPTSRIDPVLDETQGSAKGVLISTIESLSTCEPNAARTAHQVIRRLSGWPHNILRIDANQRLLLAQDCHFSAHDTALLAQSAIRLDDFYTIQLLDAAGHRPLAPALIQALHESKEGNFGWAVTEAFSSIIAEDPRLSQTIAPTVISLTWGEACQAAIGKAAAVLPADRFIALCQDLVVQSHGENRGILSHVVNILARDPRNLPVDALRRLALSAQWHDDRDEVLWALGLIADPSLTDIIPRLLLDPEQPLSTRALALALATRLRIAAAGPAILAILADANPDSDNALLQSDAVIASLALALPFNREQVNEWASDDWGADPDPDTLALEGPAQRYRILAATMALWLTTRDPTVWPALQRSIAHPWRRYRCYLITLASISGHANAYATIMDIADLDSLLNDDDHDLSASQTNVYLTALSQCTLDADQRAQAEARFGLPIPARVPMPSPRFTIAIRPGDGGPAAPLP